MARNGRTLLRRLAVDTTPLRESPPFRRLWVGTGLSSIGSSMTQYAVALQVFLISHSSLDVGLIGLAVAVPTVTVSLTAGALIDRVERRAMVLACTSAQAALSAVLAYQAIAHLGQLWLLYVVVVAQASVAALNVPARRSFVPSLLRTDQLAAGTALTALAVQVARIVGPALAGLLTATSGLGACYLADALSFAFSLYAVARLVRVTPAPGGGTARGIGAALEGFRFIAGEKLVLGALVADMTAAFLAVPVALFPAINAARFSGNPETLGLMTTALAVGGVVGSGLSGPASRIGRRGLAILAGGALWGAGIATFGLAAPFWADFAALAVAGAGDATAVFLRSAVVQEATPEALRGRVFAAERAAGAGIPQLGDTRAGLIASLATPGLSAIVGGLSAIAGAVVVAALVPDLLKMRARPAGPPASRRQGER
ncbi:MAG: MFS transporter [Actinomycetota bacterium]|nr:MFS transporter [Actinomycetota bacterium]